MRPEARLVAHRGDRCGGDENTLDAFAAAVAAGARFLEGDVQLTSDGVAIIRHDATPLAWSSLRKQEPKTLLLADLFAWLDQQSVEFFLELKPELLMHGPADGVCRRLEIEANERLVIISASQALLEAAARSWPSMRLGWVAEEGAPPACSLSFVFCEQKRLTATVEQWQATACIVCYTVNMAQDVPPLLAAGAELVETDHFTRMRRELSHADASI